MKIIEAMKRVKSNKQKIEDLRQLITNNSARHQHETPKYEDASAKVLEWAQSAHDTMQENVRLLVAIARTNLVTQVTIKLGDNSVSRPIAEWVWRRREYAAMDLAVWSAMTDRGLKEGTVPSSTGIPMEVKIVRAYSPEQRDRMVAMYKGEAGEIDSALEVVNAVTDLIEATT